MANLELWRDRPLGRSVDYDVTSPIDRLFRDMQTLMEPMRGGNLGAGMSPLCDISESDDQYTFSMDLPGVKADDIDVEINGNQLNVTAERQSKEEQGESGKREFRERFYGRYRRSISLPDDVDTENVNAQYKDGVLELTIPKSEARKPRRISVGGSGESSAKTIEADTSRVSSEKKQQTAKSQNREQEKVSKAG